MTDEVVNNEEEPKTTGRKGRRKKEEKKKRKLCLVASKGSLDMAYPPLILANAARMSGIECHIFAPDPAACF